ncbi:MAG TPA: TldD/PmbA family protein [Candidatus Binatia bacterium]
MTPVASLHAVSASLESLARRFSALAPRAEFWSLRAVEERDDQIAVRRGVVQPPRTTLDLGVMVTVADQGGIGYAATCDVSDAGLRRAAEQARAWAASSGRYGLFDRACLERLLRAPARGTYESVVRRPWDALSLADKVDLLRAQCERLKRDERIVDWSAALWRTESTTLLVTSTGSEIRQTFHCLLPMLSATAAADGESVTRSLGGHHMARQGGLEILDDVGFLDAAPRVAEQALELLAAPDCPTATQDLLLAPDQMILQIHESIGHPLELDRILGDERNYAGTSFVTPDMFGRYRYGSELLNVTFDPTRAGELASYAFDDEGTPAERTWIIRNGILLQPLGGALSQARAGLPGVANARANGWNRPPIDRMANLNLEPGTSSFEDMVRAVERGVYMESNCSWSIDDSRNKFQFGCEWGRVIVDGELRHVVKKPNYRGVSASFWRSLAMVGDESTVQVLGTPFCGKGEPNQVIRVGHASPACLFRNVETFGGA